MPQKECARLRRQRSLLRESDKAITGSESTVRCTCKINLRRTKETIASGLKIIRTRFALARGELPDLKPEALDKYLLKLLDSQSPTLPFPRAQSGWCAEGFPNFKRLSRRDRWMLAQSCASIKRSLPKSCCEAHPPPSSFPAWSANACQASPPQPTPEYLRFCRKVVREEFWSGWDRGLYSSFCESFLPRRSNRADFRCKGGHPWNSSDWWSICSNRSEYLAATLRGRIPPQLPSAHVLRFKEVLSAGKPRPLGIPSLRYDLLGPLHKTVYQHLTRKKWLLRGKATEKRITSTCVNEHQTSVDLVAATDGLSLVVAETILGALLAKSVEVPGTIIAEAMYSLRPTCREDGDLYEVSHGQMMGSYLSFPLLCLQSYCAARWACREDDTASFLVNGDDTLISSKLDDVLDRYPAGFRINRKKTKVSRNVAEINSTTFIRETKRGWKEIRSMRRGGGRAYLLEGVRHLATACVNAGPKWQSAFIRSGIVKGTFIDPVDLGLDRRIHDVWRSSVSVFKSGRKRELPKLEQVIDDRLEAVEYEPSYTEQTAVRQLIFNDGRFEPDSKRETFTRVKSLPITGSSRLRSSVSPRLMAKMRTHLSYRPDIRTESKGRELKGFVVRDWAPTTSAACLATKEIEGDVYLVSNLWW